MKKILFFVSSIILLNGVAHAQNTFPVNGNVGIGTTSTNDKLEVVKDFSGLINNSVASFKMTDAGINNSVRILQKNGGGQYSIDLINAYSNGVSVFNMNGEGKTYFGGNVGIGAIAPDAKLTVAGNIHAREVKVSVNAGADFVFDDSYKPLTLKETEQFIKANKHLPGIIPAKEMLKEGINLSEMNIKLLQKIEELTLYLIEQDREVKELKREIKTLKKS